MKNAPKIATLLAAVISIVFISYKASADATYTYDSLGRVTAVKYDNGICVAYVYDANGNRISQNNTASGTPSSPTWGSGVWGCFKWQ